jgi:hypothetical protein
LFCLFFCIKFVDRLKATFPEAALKPCIFSLILPNAVQYVEQRVHALNHFLGVLGLFLLSEQEVLYVLRKPQCGFNAQSSAFS